MKVEWTAMNAMDVRIGLNKIGVVDAEIKESGPPPYYRFIALAMHSLPAYDSSGRSSSCSFSSPLLAFGIISTTHFEQLHCAAPCSKQSTLNPLPECIKLPTSSHQIAETLLEDTNGFLNDHR